MLLLNHPNNFNFIMSCPTLMTLLIFSFISNTISQQEYVNNKQLDCENNYNSTSGNVCNSVNSCQSYLTFQSNPPYNTLSSISNLLNASPSLISQSNNISTLQTIPTDTILTVPVTCSCTGNKNYYQHNTSYTLKTVGETYFAVANHTYSFLYHQKEMVSDRVRMDTYFNAVFENKHHFKDKVVLDVGAGSGILAIWSAQAGAKKVYAVEATKMSEHARALVKANNLENVVQVIEGSMEDVTLPEKVDAIISEWMGYFLLRESMFDSVISARDRWLKPTGVMYPSHARMWMAPIRTGIVEQKLDGYQSAMGDWHNFVDETKACYGVDMSTLSKPFAEEQRKCAARIAT